MFGFDKFELNLFYSLRVQYLLRYFVFYRLVFLTRLSVPVQVFDCMKDSSPK